MNFKPGGQTQCDALDQMREAIDIVETLIITAAGVKRAMVAELDLSGGIDPQTLGGGIERLLTEREVARMTRLIDALPPTSLDVADSVAATIRSDAEQRVADREDGLAAQRDHNAALVSQIGAKDLEIARLENRVTTLSKDLAATRAEGQPPRQRVLSAVD